MYTFPQRPLLLGLLVLPAFTTLAMATDYIVQPGQSIQAAIDAAVDGDRVLVNPGTYQQVFEFKGKRIEVRSTGGAEVTIIDGSAFATSIVRCDQGEPLGTKLTGFTLTNGRGRGFPSSYGLDYYGGALFAAGGTRLAVEDCRFVHNGWNSGGFNNCTFGGAIYCGESQITLVRCLLVDNFAWASGGASLSNGTGSLMTFDRCTVVANMSTNFFGPQGGIGMANDGDVLVRDSIVWGNFGNQIDAFGFPYNQGCVATAAWSCIQNGFAGTGNISVDPRFVSPATLDYRLQPNSPCINAGDPAATADPDGSRRDMGAYPFLEAPAIECVARVNSAGCTPQIGWLGWPNLGGADDFRVTASNVITNTNGVLFVGSSAAATPYFGGTLCVGGTVWRGPIQPTNGSGACGTMTITLSHQWFIDRGIAPGTTLRAQFAYRDQGYPLGSNVGTTDALRFVLGP
jgi:hypothetical protein